MCSGDLAGADCDLAPFLHECDVVFHCAGEIHDVSSMRRLHVDGTQRLLLGVHREAARSRREIHFVQLSSVGVYGPPRDRKTHRIVKEDAPYHPVGEYEATKTQADELVVESAAPGVLSYTILRPTIVFGEGMPNASLRAMMLMVKRGWFFYIGREGAIANYVHVDDVVAALLKVAHAPGSKGQIYNLSCDCPLDGLIKRMAFSLDVRAPVLRLPESSVRMIAALFSRWPKMPLTSARVDALCNKTSYPADKIVTELGFQFSRRMPDAIEDLVHEIR